MFVPPSEGRRLPACLSLGVASHLVADAFLQKAAGTSSPFLWPLTDIAPPLPGVYLSSNVWPALVVGALAVGLWLLDRRVVQPDASR